MKLITFIGLQLIILSVVIFGFYTFIMWAISDVPYNTQEVIRTILVLSVSIVASLTGIKLCDIQIEQITQEQMKLREVE